MTAAKKKKQSKETYIFDGKKKEVLTSNLNFGMGNFLPKKFPEMKTGSLVNLHIMSKYIQKQINLYLYIMSKYIQKQINLYLYIYIGKC